MYRESWVKMSLKKIGKGNYNQNTNLFYWTFDLGDTALSVTVGARATITFVWGFCLDVYGILMIKTQFSQKGKYCAQSVLFFFFVMVNPKLCIDTGRLISNVTPCSQVPIFSMTKISAWYYLELENRISGWMGSVTHSARQSHWHHWHNVIKISDRYFSISVSSYISARVNKASVDLLTLILAYYIS